MNGKCYLITPVTLQGSNLCLLFITIIFLKDFHKPKIIFKCFTFYTKNYNLKTSLKKVNEKSHNLVTRVEMSTTIKQNLPKYAAKYSMEELFSRFVLKQMQENQENGKKS